MVNLILSPPASLCQAQDQWIVSLYMALTIEEIWHNRNAILQQEGKVDLHHSIHSI